MKLILRTYQTEGDYWRLRAFLRETFELHGRREYNWSVPRLDYWRWHVLLNCQDTEQMSNRVYLWEDDHGRVAAALIAEDPGSAHLQTHPACHSTALEEEMIALGEEKLSITRDGQQVLSVWTDSQDSMRRDILTCRGFRRGKWTESQWRRDLHDPIPDVEVAPGYEIRCLGDASELPARSWASWRGFHPDEPDEKYEGWTWYHNIQRCPLYRRDLDIVAVAPTGEIASFSTFWYDDATRSVYIEPVATVPEHQRLGLARACITEGLRRVRRMGATRAFVGGFEPGPNALYSSTLSPEQDEYEQWVKKW
jgi:GNAT superfamily N-acetyltransferase